MSEPVPAFRIAIDCMGGDKGPAEVIAGIRVALRKIGSGDSLVLVGRENEIKPALAAAKIDDDPRVVVRNASEVILMTDKPMQAIKSKKDASMLRALDMLKAGEVDAVLSTGNTKVLVGAGLLKLRTVEGADRPSLVTIWPRHGGHFIMLDAGANPETTPEQLVHSAVLGALYAKAVLGLACPRVGLLTVGTEEGKGGERINKTHTLLKSLGPCLNYSGPVEGYDLFEDSVDVAVTDGFTGNVVLKTSEGIFHMFQSLVKERLKRNPLYLIGGVILLPMLLSLKRHLRPDAYGGAPLLGLNGLVIKAHGSANAKGIASAISICRVALLADIVGRSKAELVAANAAIAATEAPATA